MANQTSSPNVNGTVTGRNGQKLPNLIVRAFDRDMRSEELLGEAVTDGNGRYVIVYSPEQFARAEKRSADLSMKVFSASGKVLLYETALDRVVFNASVNETIDIAVTAEIKFEDNEFDAILREIAGLIGEVKVPELEENDDRRDLTFLSKETGIDIQKLQYLVVAHRLARESGGAAAFFYALLRENTLLKTEFTQALRVRLFIDVSTELKPLLFDAARIGEEIIRRDVKAAVEEAIVPATATREVRRNLELLQKFRGEAEEFYQKEYPKKVLELLGGFFVENKIAEIGRIFEENKHDLQAFFKKITDPAFFKSDPKAADARVTMALADMLGFDQAVISRVRELPAIKKAKDVKELARLNKAEWTEVLAKSAGEIETNGKKLNKNMIDFHASALARKFEKEFPTVAFSAQLERAEEPVLQNQKAIKSFLKKHGDFDLQKNNVDLFLKEKELTGDKNAAMGEELKSVQRVFRLVPRFSPANALLQQKIDSAHSIAAMGETQFVNDIAPGAGIGEKEAAQIFQKAERANTAAMLIAGELQDTMRTMDISALQIPSLTETISSVISDFPNLKSLFKLTDSCACGHCNSVYSPAAYLVEIIRFLDKRKVKNSSGLQGNAKVELFSRRPDLGDIDLGCENANTPLPYIDLVCELLEEAIAPDAGVQYTTGALTVGSTAANPAAGGISTSLFNALTVAGIPVTAKAQVFATETSPGVSAASQPFYLRDTKAVCKITSNSGGGFTVKRLRQTLSTAAELAAAPEYVNANAYNLLRNSSFAFKLPFDLDLTEAKAYFSRFGIERYELMTDFQVGSNPTDRSIAAEMLGLTRAERRLIVKADVPGQSAFWNTTAATAAAEMANVDTFLTKSGLTYAELELLLSLKFIDQPDNNPSNNIFIFHPDLTCDTSGKIIKNLTDDVLDRIHRFLRLQKKTGWKFETLDEIISQPNLGNMKLDNACLITASRLLTISKETGIALETLVGFYGEIPHTPLTGDSGKTLYERIFLNKARNGFINEALLPDKINGSQQLTTFLPPTATASPSQTLLSVCLQISEQDLDRLIKDIFPSGGALNFSNLSTLFAAATVMRKTRLNANDFIILRNLTKLKVEISPQQTLDFIRAAAKSKQGPLKPADVMFMLWHEAANLADREIKDGRITQLLIKLQADFEKATLANQSPFDIKLTADEQKEALGNLLSKLPGIGEEDVRTMVSFVDADWGPGHTFANANAAKAFVNAKLSPIFDTIAIGTQILFPLNTAAAAAAAPNPSTAVLSGFENERRNLVGAFMASVSKFLLTSELQNLLYQAIAAAFKVDAAMAQAVLDNAGLLQATPTVPGVIRDILLSKSLVNTPITPAAFSEDYDVFRLLHKLFPLIKSLKLTSEDAAWHLQNNGLLGWLQPDGIPYQAGHKRVGYFVYTAFLDVLSAAAEMPPVPDPADLENPMTLHRLAEMNPTGINPRDEWVEAYSLLSGYSKDDVAAIDTWLFPIFNILDHRTAKTWKAIDKCAEDLRKLGCPVAAVLEFIKPVLTNTDTQTLRATLKNRYDEDTWLDTLKQITDAVRPQKRNALVAFMLAADPSLKDENSLFDRYLVDVEMESCMPSSRIVQAHGTTQIFVRRCLMGLEPQAAADVSIDSKWDQWKWMKNYRVWEANRKIFLYPENWIEPELRDDKSFLFKEMEDELLQNELNEFTAEQALIKYVEKLDNIAFLEVVATWYQADNYTMHIFSRTKGGDPASYYYRKLEHERYYTPLEKVEVEITGDHLLAYFRNNRLCLAWPIFSDVTEPDPQVIVPSGGSGTPVPLDKPRRRTKINLAVSEYANKQWQPKKISAEGIKTPSYFTTDPLPKENYNLMYLEQTEQIMIFSSRIASGSEYHQLNGIFTIAGCKGYPEPAFEGERPLLDFYPDFKDSVLSAQRYKELGWDNSDDLAVRNAFSFTGFSTVLAKTPGNFRLTYPHQVTRIDEIAYFLQYIMLLFQNGHFRDSGIHNVMGTLLPYFMEDSDHAYAIIPGFYGMSKDPKTNDLVRVKHTGSDVLQLLEDIFAIQAKYAALHAKNPEMDVFKEMNRDNDYQQILRRIEICKTLTAGEEFKVLYHPLVCSLRKTLYNDGIPELMKRETQQRVTPFDFAAHYQPASKVVKPYPVEDIDFSSGGSYSAYNWELFFHVPFLLAARLSKNQQFEKALEWFRYMFDPTGALPGPVPQKYWVTRPFFETLGPDYIAQRIDRLLYRIADPATPEMAELEFAVDQWRAKPFKPDVIARFRPVAYQKALLMKYIDNLMEWGDYLFRQDTMESVAQATQMYITADKLLGPKPRTIPAPVKPPNETYNQLEAKLDALGNGLIGLENILPDRTVLPEGGAELPTAPISLSTLYFCIPQNDKMLEYWERIANRMFNIHHCLNIEGVPRSLALFAPPIDPALLVKAAASGLDISSILAGMNASAPFYRFNTLAQKATELVQEVRGLGNSLLQALEKKDAEAMALLRSELEIKVLNAVTDMKNLSIKEAAEQIKALKLTKVMTEERHKFYANIEKIIPNEQLNLDKLAESHKFQNASQISQTLAGILGMIPDLVGGLSGVGGSPHAALKWGGKNLAGAAQAASNVLSILSAAASYEASRASILGGYDRRFEDCKLQERLAQKELKQIDQQIVGAEIRREIAETDLKNHKLQIENAKKTDDFMRFKYTNKDLYQWMIGQVSSVYFRAYRLAYDTAMKAERCYRFELGSDDTFIGFGYWDSLKKGLQSADLLLHDIKRMETGYLDKNRREYEITKHVSLALLDPLALVMLRETGSCDFEIPEALYDMDHPGQYFRRLKSVSTSLPCIAGPYTSVSAKLSLTGNRYRKNNAQTADPDPYAEVDGNDARFVYNVGAIQSIATSSAQNDSGMFEFNFRDERYLPFEGCGAISTWRLELPEEIRQFDYATIADVVLHVKYTSREGGSGLKKAAGEVLTSRLDNIKERLGKTGLHVALNMKHDMPNEWHLFKTNGIVDLKIDKSRLPYFAQLLEAGIDSMTLLAKVAGTPSTYSLNISGNNLNSPGARILSSGQLGSLWVSPAITGLVLGDSFTLASEPPPPVTNPPAPDPLRLADLKDLMIIVNYKFDTSGS
jgi:hypothetical protein